VAKEAHLSELGWYTEEVMVTYMECKRCGEKRCHVKENRGQGVIRDRQKWCGYQGRREEKTAWPRECHKKVTTK